jgi:hypothetical protein
MKTKTLKQIVVGDIFTINPQMGYTYNICIGISKTRLKVLRVDSDASHKMVQFMGFDDYADRDWYLYEPPTKNQLKLI